MDIKKTGEKIEVMSFQPEEIQALGYRQDEASSLLWDETNIKELEHRLRFRLQFGPVRGKFGMILSNMLNQLSEAFPNEIPLQPAVADEAAKFLEEL
jgi:hypothetical protein